MLVAGLWLALLVHAALAFPGTPSVTRDARARRRGLRRDCDRRRRSRALPRPVRRRRLLGQLRRQQLPGRRNGGVARALGWIELRFAIGLASRVRRGRGMATRRGEQGRAPSHAPVVVRGGCGRDRPCGPRSGPAPHTARGPAPTSPSSRCSPPSASRWRRRTRAHVGAGAPSRARRSVERLVVELARAPQPRLAPGRPRSCDRRPVTADQLPACHATGSSTSRPRRVRARRVPTRAVTPIVRDGDPIALVQHDPAALEAALETARRDCAPGDRERAASRRDARPTDRAQGVARADRRVERPRPERLERDLHDGASSGSSRSRSGYASRRGARPRGTPAAASLADADARWMRPRRVSGR